MKCTLCETSMCVTAPTKELTNLYSRNFRQCQNCFLIFVEPSFLPKLKEEKERYQQHKEDSAYPSYIEKALSPIINSSLEGKSALDFGSGNSSEVVKMLSNIGVRAFAYDPIFKDETELLNAEYDIITCIEVVEHFHQPFLEFKKLKNMLSPNGLLLVRTKLFHSKIAFNSWWYVRDFTHVSFYTHKTFELIAKRYKLEIIEISNEHVLFKNKP